MAIPTNATSAAQQTAKAFFMVDPTYLGVFVSGPPIMPTFICRYNPKDLAITGGASWAKPETNQEGDVPPAQFVKPNPRSMTIKLLIDHFELPSGDVEREVDVLFAWTRPRKRPLPGANGQISAPMLRFQWGAKRWFKCFIKTMGVTYTMFSRTGTPLRAEVSLTLEELTDTIAFTNPTSGGEGGERVHLVRAGDSLHAVAQQHYGQARFWRGLAAFNGIDDPLRLATGTTLAIPDVTTVGELS